jgi:hypothetical protein
MPLKLADKTKVIKVRFDFEISLHIMLPLFQYASSIQVVIKYSKQMRLWFWR